jgi:hypothetical protein
MNSILTFFGCFFILLSSAKEPEWLVIPSWICFFVLACWQSWFLQKQVNKNRIIRIFLVYCTFAIFFGYGSAGLIQNAGPKAWRWFTTAAILFTLANILSSILSKKFKNKAE